MTQYDTISSKGICSCPRCHKKAVIVRLHETRFIGGKTVYPYFVKCSSCAQSTIEPRTTPNEAAEDWNHGYSVYFPF